MSRPLRWRVRWAPWRWAPQGFHRTYRHSVNWWHLSIGPLYVQWTPIRSQAYLEKRRTP